MSTQGDLELAGSRESSAGHTALMKLLSKLGLIGADQLSCRFLYNDLFPIAYFAKAGSFDEWKGILAVATELRIQPQRIGKAEEHAALILMDQDPISRIPLTTWRKIRAVPIGRGEHDVVVAMSNPLEIDAIRELEFDLQLKVRLALSPESEIMSLLSQRSDGRDGLDFNSLLQASEKPEIRVDGNLEPDRAQGMESNIINEDISAPTVIRLVNKIFSGAIRRNASDIHITPESNRLVVKIRIDGIMHEFLQAPKELKEPVVSRIKVLCGMDIAEKRFPQDGRLRLKTNLGDRDLRIATVPTVYGEDVVARILSSELTQTTFESLGLSDKIRAKFERALNASSKVNIVTGPTGSGKTSSLYAGVMYLRDGTNRIITIEDPIEYRIQGVSQIQVNPKIEMTFAAALRSVLRQDPDVIMVGEIRDSETATTAMQVAQTGHLVLSTLHTNTAPAAITRLRDLGIPSFLIASSLGSVMAQRLVRRLCTACAKPADEAERRRCAELGIEGNLRTACGCAECSGTGYRGRVGVFSFLEITPSVAAAIREDCGEDEIEKRAAENGYQSLAHSGLELIRSGVSSLCEVERVLGPIDAAQPAPQMLPAKPVPIPAEEEHASVLQKRKILLVDDDEDVRSIFQSLLEYEMFEVKEAENGILGLQALYESPPDLVILDLMMPKMNGLEMLERMRNDPRMKNIPVLIITGASTEENEVKLIKSGADDFVSKTTSAQVVVARINRLINRSAA